MLSVSRQQVVSSPLIKDIMSIVAGFGLAKKLNLNETLAKKQPRHYLRLNMSQTFV